MKLQFHVQSSQFLLLNTCCSPFQSHASLCLCTVKVSLPQMPQFFDVPGLFQIITCKATGLLTICLCSIHLLHFQWKRLSLSRNIMQFVNFQQVSWEIFFICSIDNLCLFKQQSPPVIPVFHLIIHFSENWMF